MNKPKRHSSICRDPKEALLNAVLKNRHDDIENICTNNGGILNERYSDKYFKPILFIALVEGAKKVRPETIDCLIKLGASLKCDPNDATHSYYEAIHFASLGLNPSLLERIIEHYINKGLDLNRASKYGGTALYVLIKDGDSLNENFERCVEILLKSGIDYRKTDENDVPPVYWAAQKRYVKIVRKLLEYADIDIDGYKSEDKSARDLIRELGIEVPVLENNKSVFDKLLSYVKQSKQNDFIELGKGVLDFNSVDLDEKTFLQYACEKNLLEVVEFLLRKGVDVNKTTEKHLSPIEIAADHGYYLILKALLSKDGILLKNALLRIMPKLDYEQRDEVDYLKCFNILIDSGKELNVNQKDKIGNCPLHYAFRYGGQEVALKLLNKSASLGNRNNYNYLSIHDFKYNTLKRHFDGCIKDDTENELDSERISITFDYETLLPTKSKSRRFDQDEEANLRRQHRTTPETDVLFSSANLQN